jgi:hypothetical protein
MKLDNETLNMYTGSVYTSRRDIIQIRPRKEL